MWLRRCYGFNRVTTHQLNVTAADDIKRWVIAAGGWQFVTRQTHGRNPGDVPKFKPGWVGSVVGSRLLIQVDTSAHHDANSSSSSGGLPQDLPTYAVDIMYLRSYTHMGTASVSCVANCTCNSAVINAYNSDQSSTAQFRALRGVTQHPHCAIQVEILQDTKSPDGGHKFKVIAVIVKIMNKAAPVHSVHIDGGMHKNLSEDK